MSGETVSRKESGSEGPGPEEPGQERRHRGTQSRWLAVGALLSLGLALSGALQPSARVAPDKASVETPDPEAFARVGEVFLTKADLRRAMESQIGLRRDTMSTHELRELLDELVEEELLMQRAQMLGLLDTDPSLRRALVIAMKEEVFSTLAEPSSDQIESFYQSRRAQYEGRTLDEVTARVLRDLDRARRQEALDQFVVSLKAKAEIDRVAMEPSTQSDESEAGSTGATGGLP